MKEYGLIIVGSVYVILTILVISLMVHFAKIGVRGNSFEEQGREAYEKGEGCLYDIYLLLLLPWIPATGLLLFIVIMSFISWTLVHILN